MDDKDVVEQIEPVRKSFLDVASENLTAASKQTYVHRLIYIGEHLFNEDTPISIADFVRQTVQEINDEYHDEPLSGILVYYPRYFCHTVEGSEDSIIKHLLLLTEDELYSKLFSRMKLLVCYHHINQRFVPTWLAVTGKPPSLLEKIDLNTDIHRTFRHVYNCVQKIYKLAHVQRSRMNAINAEASAASDDNKSDSTVTSRGDSRSTLQMEKVKQSTNTSFIIDKYPECLPEYGLIEFLLSTQYLEDLQTYIKLYGVVPQLDAYKDKVWPVPTEFVPFHIFDAPIDPVTDLPTAAPQEADAFKDIIE